jgi:hypothetical protein
MADNDISSPFFFTDIVPPADTSPFAKRRRHHPSSTSPTADHDSSTQEQKSDLSPTSFPLQPTPTSMPATHNISTWARSTHFVMSLLWHSKVLIPECSLFDENAAIQDHLFVGSCKHRDEDYNDYSRPPSPNSEEEEEDAASGSSVHNAGRVLRSTRDNTTLDQLFQRLERKVTSATPLCAVNRAVGTHGAVLSVAGLNATLDDLRAQFSTPTTRYDENEEIRPDEDDADDFCIQQYIEPIDGVRYEVTCTRQAAEVGVVDADPNIITIDVVPSNYANFYTYPSNYVPSSVIRQRKVAPPSDDLRQRMCTLALSVLRHAEVAHDVRMVHVVFEMIVARNEIPHRKSANRKRRGSKRGNRGGVNTARRVEVYVTGAAEVHWVMAPGGWRTLRAAPTIARGKGREAKMEADIAFEANGFQDPHGSNSNGNLPGRQRGGLLRGSESAPTLAPSLNVRRQARHQAQQHPSQSQSHQQLLPQSLARSFSSIGQPTIHTASGSNLAVRKAFGPTSTHPTDLRPTSLLSSSSEASMQIVTTVDRGDSRDDISMARIGDASGQPMRGGLLTNIRVAGRDGRDELHVQLSTELRKAQVQHRAMQNQIDLLVATEAEHLSKVAGLEAAHGRLRKTLRTTESNLETHAMEARQRIESLQTMLAQTQQKLSISTADAARERSLRIQKQKLLEGKIGAHRVLKIRHDELVSRLALVADMERNGSEFRTEKEKLEHDHAALRKTHEIVLSEAEELRQRLGMAEEEILQQRALRKTLYMLMGDLRTPGVRPPKRVAGGFSTYPRPSKRNVAKAVKLIVDGEIADAWKTTMKKKRKTTLENSAGHHLKSLRDLKKTRDALNTQTPSSPGASVDTPGVVRFLKSMFGKRTLYGKAIPNASVLFRLVDRDHSGSISKEELVGALTRLDSGLTHEQISTLVSTFDSDLNGMIDRQEFESFFQFQ